MYAAHDPAFPIRASLTAPVESARCSLMAKITRPRCARDGGMSHIRQLSVPSRPSSQQVVRVMAAAQSVDISVSVDWALPPAANALSVLPTSTTVKHGDVARLFAAWLPDALERTCWRPEHAHIVVRRGDGLSVRIPVAAAAPPAATDASSSRSDAAVPFSLSMGRNVAALAVQSALKALEAAEDRELTDAAKQGIVAPEVLRSAVRQLIARMHEIDQRACSAALPPDACRSSTRSWARRRASACSVATPRSSLRT